MTTEAAITLDMDSNGVYTSEKIDEPPTIRGIGKSLGRGLENLARGYVKTCELLVVLPAKGIIGISNIMAKGIAAPVEGAKHIHHNIVVKKVEKKIDLSMDVIRDIQFPDKWGLEDRATVLQILARLKGVKMDLKTCVAMVLEATPELTKPKAKRRKRRSVSKTTVKKK